MRLLSHGRSEEPVVCMLQPKLRAGPVRDGSHVHSETDVSKGSEEKRMRFGTPRGNTAVTNRMNVLGAKRNSVEKMAEFATRGWRIRRGRDDAKVDEDSVQWQREASR